MKYPLAAFLVGFAWSASAAGLSILRPREGATVPVLFDLQKSFITNSAPVRRALVDDIALRKAAMLSVGSRPRWLELAWSRGEGCPTNAEYEVRVFKLPEDREVCVRTTRKTTKHVANLEIGADYRWTVSTVTPAGERLTGEGRFRTEDLAPRLLFFGKVPNVRDLGGRRGLDGRRVRQGMIFRSAGLNSNAKKPKEKGGKAVPGRPNLTPEEVSAILKTFGIRTDVDLRADWECYGMTGSPLGESVRWVHVPSSSYGDMAGAYGKNAFARVFRVFLDEKNYPIDFHCIAGADRTGAVAYILGALLGYSDDDLLLDWEVTAFYDPNPVFAHRRFDQLVKAFAKMPGATTVERVENYVKSIGFTDGDVGKFRSLLLEPDAAGEPRAVGTHAPDAGRAGRAQGPLTAEGWNPPVKKRLNEVIEGNRGGKSAYAVFDFDYTMVIGDLSYTLIWRILEKEKIDPVGWWKAYREVYQSQGDAAAVAWRSKLFGNYSSAELRALAKESIAADLACGGMVRDQRVPTEKRGLAFAAEMLELVRELEDAGIAVYVVSGSRREALLAATDGSFGISLPAERVFGADDGVVAGKKPEFIRRHIAPNHGGSDPVLVAGDSFGDYSMLTEFKHAQAKLLFRRQWQKQEMVSLANSGDVLVQGRDETRGCYLPSDESVYP